MGLLCHQIPGQGKMGHVAQLTDLISIIRFEMAMPTT